MLDTSSLISVPTVYKDIDPGSLVIIPIAVLGELDKLKKFPGGSGRNARVAIRNIDALSNLGDITTGVVVDGGTIVKVDARHFDLSSSVFSGFGDPDYGDTQILACAYSCWAIDKSVVLVSNDINLRTKAKARGIGATGYDGEAKVNELYAGTKVVVDPARGYELLDKGYIPSIPNLSLHEFITFTDTDGTEISSGRKVSGNKIKVVKNQQLWKVSPRNKEQKFAADLIMDKGIDLVTLVGPAGCGKSLIALAAALELVLTRNDFDKLIVYRPIQAMGADIGYVPGSIEEKLAPWFEAIMDSFEVLFGGSRKDWKKDLEMFKKKGKIELGALTYIRGRSLPNSIILCDEFQNLTKEEAKTILTRVGEGTKIILTGDIDQIDKEDLDAGNNGLTYVIEKFKDIGLAGHITLVKGERSKLATVASEIL